MRRSPRLRVPRAFRRTPFAASRLLARYLAHRVALPRALERGGLDELLAALDRRVGSAPAASAGTLTDVVRVGDALARRAPPIARLGDTCLYRALARYALAMELGLAPSFVIGLRPDAASRPSEDALGHAWIEIDGAPVPREAISSYVVSMRHTRQGGAIR